MRVTNPSRTSIGMQITKARVVERFIRRIVTGGGPSLGPSNHAQEGNNGDLARQEPMKANDTCPARAWQPRAGGRNLAWGWGIL